MWDWIVSHFAQLHALIFETLVQPALFRLNLMSWAEPAFDATELFLIGAIEVAVLYALLRPLEALAPVERWTDRREASVDIIYSLLTRLGLLPMFFFLALTPAFDWINGNLRMNGVIPPNLEDLIPYLKDAPLASAVAYLAIIDFFDYWRHRWQHRFNLWWALHSLHHSQRQMTFWTDDREHLLDQAIAAAFRAAIGLAIGVPPAQFLTISVVAAAIESLAHANVRLNFGVVGERVLVSPRFHRLHHAVSIGHEGPHRGCNFGAVFSLWDVLFKTARFDAIYKPTGIADQAAGRDYGSGFWAQQWLGLRRLWAVRQNRIFRAN
jgi:sterol desaturase/sphingolipid hydroxylase (fatty acid hydroxylase superfamily)